MNRAFLLVACLLVAAPAMASGLFGGPHEAGQMPSRFVRFEGIADGPCFVNGPPLLFGRLARVTVVLNRVRIGTAFVDGYGKFDGWSGNTVLPLRVGYTLFSRPVKTQFIYGAVPDVYVELSGSPWGPDSVTGALGFRYGPSLRAALCCDVDYGGVGARFETGWADIYRDDLFLGPIARKSFIYAGLQLRLLTIGIGF